MRRKGKEMKSALGASEGARRATGEVPSAPAPRSPGSGGRFSVGRKVAVIRAERISTRCRASWE